MRWKKQEAAPDSPSTQHAPATFVPPHQLSQVNDFTFSFTGQCHGRNAHRQEQRLCAIEGQQCSTRPRPACYWISTACLLVSVVSLAGVWCGDTCSVAELPPTSFSPCQPFRTPGDSPSVAIKRERLRARNAILKSTGFLEPGVHMGATIGLQERNRLAIVEAGGLSRALQQQGNTMAAAAVVAALESA